MMPATDVIKLMNNLELPCPSPKKPISEASRHHRPKPLQYQNFLNSQEINCP
jgi:hypothetical protein